MKHSHLANCGHPYTCPNATHAGNYHTCPEPVKKLCRQCENLRSHPDRLSSSTYITLKLTHMEAWAVLRGLAVANNSPDQIKADVAPCTWAARRLLGLVDSTGQGE